MLADPPVPIHHEWYSDLVITMPHRLCVLQMADKKLQQQRDKAADMAAAKELSEQLLAEKERLKLEKIQRSNAMRATAHQQRKAINAETRQRFRSCQGAMDTAERKYHGEVLQVRGMTAGGSNIRGVEQQRHLEALKPVAPFRSTAIT